ncbi:MAG: hypothetical protein OI860_00635 (plasmid) [Candidatus Methanoperedens sp.]|uniref:hypothetical protein n=1 Tax=Candidatus Methanoperedens sp. BLZ2 TaxID=2035255 RepID=UPI000BE454EC|nr:hypothetical protein [Candidatus Methanoperedens sp. BLZ2]KAB2945269.1 MAG: hypothetical protein F9K14_11585 [Candidatus Methanoperedens sp.]MBZ0175588.1 hypothetical protein [Candidatus Methanoperedens nitroreducens]WAH95139.1 MAG: hypothetical protein OI863_00680 [Candidatus Methanoperedens sp.]WAM22301.1 MAG: hypothetical protein OI860_00635 [Candidatus Methanoperedens sp.]
MMPDFPLRKSAGSAAPKIRLAQLQKRMSGSGNSWIHRGIENMESIEDVKKAFRQARIVGEELLSKGKMTWDSFAAMMVGFEQKLREMGQEI